MLKGAWKNPLCLRLPMKVSITTQGYHHNLQRHEIHGEPCQAQAQQSIYHTLSMFGLRCSCTYFAWFKHDIQSEQLLWLWGVSSSSVLAFRQADVNPQGGLKEVCKIGSSLKNSLSCFFLPFLGNQCFKQCRVFGFLLLIHDPTKKLNIIKHTSNDKLSNKDNNHIVIYKDGKHNNRRL